MRKLLSIAFCSTVLLVVQAQERDRLLEEIENYRTSIVNNAQYKISYRELWTNLYALMSEKYSIARESESRRFISTMEQEDNAGRYTVEAEIVGDSGLYRVVFKCVSKVIEKRNVKIENRMKLLLYARINGDMELPADLRNRLDAYNADKSEKKQLIAGRDY